MSLKMRRKGFNLGLLTDISLFLGQYSLFPSVFRLLSKMQKNWTEPESALMSLIRRESRVKESRFTGKEQKNFSFQYPSRRILRVPKAIPPSERTDGLGGRSSTSPPRKPKRALHQPSTDSTSLVGCKLRTWHFFAHAVPASAVWGTILTRDLEGPQGLRLVVGRSGVPSHRKDTDGPV